MDKKEKYINFIVDDMIKKTDIDYDQEIIKFPYSPYYSYYPSILSSPSYFLLLTPSLSISKYVIERYGIHDNDVDIIWKLYKGKIKEVIDNG